jgi:hypothetical protein
VSAFKEGSDDGGDVTHGGGVTPKLERIFVKDLPKPASASADSSSNSPKQ